MFIALVPAALAGAEGSINKCLWLIMGYTEGGTVSLKDQKGKNILNKFQAAIVKRTLSAVLPTTLCLQKLSRKRISCVATSPLDHRPTGQVRLVGKDIVSRLISAMWGFIFLCLQNWRNSAVKSWKAPSTDPVSNLFSLSIKHTKLDASQCFATPRCQLCQKSTLKKLAFWPWSSGRPDSTGGMLSQGGVAFTVEAQEGWSDTSSNGKSEPPPATSTPAWHKWQIPVHGFFDRGWRGTWLWVRLKLPNFASAGRSPFVATCRKKTRVPSSPTIPSWISLAISWA